MPQNVLLPILDIKRAWWRQSKICIATAAKLFSVVASVFVFLCSAPTPSLAQGWPSQPIKYIVPFPPGGATDIISRPIAEKLRERLGQPVIIENIGGGGGSIGAARVAHSPPDGYVVGLGNSATHTITPHLLSKVPYDPVTDFTPIAILNEYVLVLVVNPSLPVQDMKQFLALARSKPNGLNYGSAGAGSSQHLAGLLLGAQADLRLVHVAYKGSGPALADVVAGHTDWMFGTISEVLSLVQSGKLRPIGITGRTTDPLMPGVPPIRDTLPNYEVVGFMGLFGPAKMPTSIVARLNTEVNAMMSAPDMVQRLTTLGMRASISTPDDLAARVKKDFSIWKSVITNAGIKPE